MAPKSLLVLSGLLLLVLISSQAAAEERPLAGRNNGGENQALFLVRAAQTDDVRESKQLCCRCCGNLYQGRCLTFCRDCQRNPFAVCCRTCCGGLNAQGYCIRCCAAGEEAPTVASAGTHN